MIQITVKEYLNGHKLDGVSEYNLKEINKETFRRIMKKCKGGKASGHTSIDGRTLKMTAPILEDGMIHLINLSIRGSKFANIWKHLTIHLR